MAHLFVCSYCSTLKMTRFLMGELIISYFSAFSRESDTMHLPLHPVNLRAPTDSGLLYSLGSQFTT